MKRPRQTLEERILFNTVVLSGEDGCWNWTGYVNPQNGYGQISLSEPDRRKYEQNRIATVPHLAARMVYGPPGGKQIVLHSCDNHLCWRPDHLSWGTHARNNREAWDRNRQKWGEQHHQARYSDAQVATLRAAVAGGATAYSAAKALGIDPCYAYRLAKGHVRNHRDTCIADGA